MKKIYTFILLGSLIFSGLVAQNQETEVYPTKDNSLFEEGELSNGAGLHLFTGVTNNSHRRRALIQFDLQGILPEGATVDSAQLIISPTLVKTAGTTVGIYKLTTAWGEGNSDADGEEGKGADAEDGDATWTRAMVGGDAWATPGGDFAPELLASTVINLGSKGVFGSPALTAVVNDWIADPSSNHGLIVIGDESKKATAIRFSSREFGNETFWPLLRLYFQEATSTPGSMISAQNMRIFPEYASANLMIKNHFGPVNSRIELYSITGALIFSAQHYLSEGENRIPTGIEGSGIYLYRVISSAGVISGKFLLQNR